MSRVWCHDLNHAYIDQSRSSKTNMKAKASRKSNLSTKMSYSGLKNNFFEFFMFFNILNQQKNK